MRKSIFIGDDRVSIRSKGMTYEETNGIKQLLDAYIDKFGEDAVIQAFREQASKPGSTLKVVRIRTKLRNRVKTAFKRLLGHDYGQS